MLEDLDLSSIQNSIDEVINQMENSSTLISITKTSDKTSDNNLNNLQKASKIMEQLQVIKQSNISFNHPIDYFRELKPWHENVKVVFPQLAGNIIPGGYILDLDSILRVLHQKTDISQEKQEAKVDGIKLYFMVKSLLKPQLSFGIVGFRGDYKNNLNDLTAFTENQFEPCKPC